MVLVSATAGEGGLAAASCGTPASWLAHRRERAAALGGGARGCARVECLGYGDSGLDGAGGPPHGADGVRPAPTSTRRPSGWPRSCARSDADVLTSYDAGRRLRAPRSRPGPPRRRAGRRARRDARRARGDRRPGPAARGRCGSPRWSTGSRPSSTARRSSAPTPRAPMLTHRVDVRALRRRKRASMAAHASQATARRRGPDARRAAAAAQPAVPAGARAGVVHRTRAAARGDRCSTTCSPPCGRAVRPPRGPASDPVRPAPAVRSKGPHLVA